MINLDKIQSMWQEDCKIDIDNMHEESIKVPQLHSKYHEILNNLILLRTKEARLTRIALGIVSLYLLCHIWRLVPTIYELIYGSEDFPNWIEHMTGFSHNMIVLNSAINFLLYLLL